MIIDLSGNQNIFMYVIMYKFNLSFENSFFYLFLFFIFHFIELLSRNKILYMHSLKSNPKNLKIQD